MLNYLNEKYMPKNIGAGRSAAITGAVETPMPWTTAGWGLNEN